MCLAVPGAVVKIETNALGMRMGTVDFDGISKEVCLAFVPEVRPGDYVIVHAGFAISRLDPREAAETLALLRELAEASEDEGAGGPGDALR